ncbi:exodeoxyribonuclease V subunit gamma, partial [Pelomonas sp. KK5]|uniref:exodeoxyribonuclease V subunit gamma n=1 Tax=Pelomonas sp. KK5 TaxID=1855730 RepID=UPI00097C8A3F
SRPELHQRFLAALAAGSPPRQPLPRRVVLFGMTHVPMQTLEALAALSGRCQVLLCVPNPCRFHWADIIEGRELLRIERRRHPLRGGVDLAGLGLDRMHAHAHPLLAAWGRQGRDFVRQLDAFDDALQSQQRFALNRLDLFDEGEGGTLLQQVQQRIRDLVPLAEHPRDAALPDTDRSIVFHIAHGPVRELEVLHDQLLDLLAAGDGLNPRDVVVMVPDVDAFAPAINAVFGQYGPGDARHIPFDIADRTERGNNPLLVAVEWLLQLPQQRCSYSELRDLLDVPALARRFGLDAAQLPRLSAWIAGAGIRWGLDPAHRASLGLAACGEQNSWLFGLRRMLLGYANGGGAALAGIEPYAEVGGLDAGLAGSLADLLDRLTEWRGTLNLAVTPEAWAARLREMLAVFFEAEDEHERLTLAALDAGLAAWLQASATAGFAAEVDLAVAREAWLSQVDEPGLSKRFRAGGVTFCTLMPMRSVPFEVVCLLGMNDGDYPRRASRSDFDLMALPGVARPGDRSRRDDDRQLMLEALLSARRLLYVSWAGRSPRDNAEQPPSVLVSQLRDYLAAGWGEDAVRARTQAHPLQPFSRRYFELGSPLGTHAAEWRRAHLEREAVAAELPPPFEEGEVPLRLADLATFLKNPVRAFFRRRLDVSFRDDDAVDEDDEPFGLDGWSTTACWASCWPAHCRPRPRVRSCPNRWRLMRSACCAPASCRWPSSAAATAPRCWPRRCRCCRPAS